LKINVVSYLESLEFLLRSSVTDRNIHDLPVASIVAVSDGNRGIARGDVINASVRDFFGCFCGEKLGREPHGRYEKKADVDTELLEFHRFASSFWWIVELDFAFQ
jgi:hypothetical protein